MLQPGEIKDEHRKHSVEVDLPYRRPYDWHTIIRFYQSHSIPGVERVTDDHFERLFRIGGAIGFVRVQRIAGAPRLRLRITPDDSKVVAEVVKRVIKMFDLDCNPALIAESFAHSPLLARLCVRFPGLRVPRGWDPFETAICSILGQLVSAQQRSKLIAQLVENYGDPALDSLSGERSRLFPPAKVLANTDLSALKTTRARREAIRTLSRRVMSGDVSLDHAQDPILFRKALLDIPGLGPWSAEYISLRAIGDTDAFPRTDLILKRALALHPELDLDSIRPWRSYAAIYLWKAFAQTLSKSIKGKRK
jgi:AraC family transcriptional regulator, regulatory protein of adaptative response / DNA-3-methyladenine glycosylase II